MFHDVLKYFSDSGRNIFHTPNQNNVTWLCAPSPCYFCTPPAAGEATRHTMLPSISFYFAAFEKRREVVLEQILVQARWDLWFPPPSHGFQTPPAINQVRTKVKPPPYGKCHPLEMYHPPPWNVPPPLTCLTPLMCHPPLICATPPMMHPHWHATLPLLAVVYGDGWQQRSTLAFGAKSLVSLSKHFLWLRQILVHLGLLTDTPGGRFSAGTGKGRSIFSWTCVFLTRNWSFIPDFATLRTINKHSRW